MQRGRLNRVSSPPERARFIRRDHRGRAWADAAPRAGPGTHRPAPAYARTGRAYPASPGTHTQQFVSGARRRAPRYARVRIAMPGVGYHRCRAWALRYARETCACQRAGIGICMRAPRHTRRCACRCGRAHMRIADQGKVHFVAGRPAVPATPAAVGKRLLDLSNARRRPHEAADRARAAASIFAGFPTPSSLCCDAAAHASTRGRCTGLDHRFDGRPVPCARVHGTS